MKLLVLLIFLGFIAKANNEQIIKDLNNLQQSNPLQPVFPNFNQNLFKNIDKNKFLSIDSADFIEQIKQKIDERFAALHPNVRQGISFSLVSEKTGQFSYAVGNSNNETALTSDMPLQIASITKVFVATLIFKLQEEGKLQISDKISVYLNNLPASINTNLTIQNLLNHSSQIYDIFNNDISMLLSCYLAPQNVPSLDEIIQNLPSYSFPNGVTNSYSNTNYTLLGLIIEEVTQKPIEEYLDEVILTPLELQNTYFLGNTPEPQNMADGWFEDNYNFLNISRVRENDLTKLYQIAFAMGNMISTPEDIAKFGYNLMNGKIINVESFKQMTQKFAFDQSTNRAYGNGLFYSRVGTIDCYQHNGSLLGYQSYLWTIPSYDVAFSFVVNHASANFAYHDNGLTKMLETIIFEILGLENPAKYNFEFASIDIIEENTDGTIDVNEKIRLNIDLIEYSQKYNSFFANIYLDGETHKINDLSPVIIDTIYSDGYTHFEKYLEISINDDVTDEVNLELVIDDVNGVNEIIKLPFKILVNENKKSLKFGSFENRVETMINNFRLDDSWTIETDFKLNSYGKNIGLQQIWSTLFCYTNSFRVLTTNGRLITTIIMEDGQNPIYFHNQTLELNKWYNLAISYDGKSQINFYLDGKNLNLTSINNFRPVNSIATLFPKVFIIGNGTNKTNESLPFEGSIDNFRVWNIALNPNELNSELTPEDKENLIFAYDFNSNLNRNVFDFSENRNGVRSSIFDYESNTSLTVDRKDLPNLNIFPIPANDNVFIQSEEIIQSVILVDLLGNKLFEKNNINSNHTQIDLSNFNIGTYVLIVKGQNTTQTKKIIVE